MRSIGFNANVTLDAWLFGEEKATGEEQKLSSFSPEADGTASPSTTPSSTAIGRSNSLPINNMSGLRPPARSKKTSLATPLGRNSIATTTADLSYPFPVSSKLRKFFRPNRLQWNRHRTSMFMSVEEKQRHLLGISAASYQRLQGHVPFTLKEIVKDPKKLPYLLQWLSSDDSELSHTNYHQVLLFLLEIEQLQLVTEDKRKEQALKIWHKYIDHSSEFQISTTLELTTELEQLVRDSIDCPDRVLDSFFPIQKLGYMRLTREEMPRFLKSTEYLQMLVDTENDTESVPMERILEQPRAAHYFLLFLMQSRQHFELYFWLHVEYVLKPLLESENYALFWKLARVLEQKAQNDSQAITLATKTDLQHALVTKALDQKQQPMAKALFVKAQQEIFVMLRSSWFDRFMKSHLYKMALKDSLIHLEREESKEDSPPKLMTRSFSSVVHAKQEEDDQEHEDDQRSRSSEDDDDDEEEEDSEEEEFSKMVLDLESIIRLTKLPDGLQVHYRPHYEAPSASLVDFNDQTGVLDTILTFATFVEKHEDREPTATLLLLPVNDIKEANEDISKRIKSFLIPDDVVLMRKTQENQASPPAILFPFQQSGRNGFLYGCVYRTYELVRVGTQNQEYFVAKGLCVLSKLPLVQTLRSLVENHIRSASDASEVFSHERLAQLFQLAAPFKTTPKSLALSPVDVSMKPFFDCFGSALALQILASALLECSVVLVASQYSLLTSCAEAIRCLLRPFSWCHVYAPVLSKPLLSYLQCPTPILVGVHSTYARRSDLPSAGFYLIADVDRQVVEYVGKQSVAWRHVGLEDDRPQQLTLPQVFERAKADLDRLLGRTMPSYDSVGPSPVVTATSFPEDAVRRLCFDVFSQLLTNHTSACLVVGDTKESVVIFDETQFLASVDPQDVLFFKALMRTQCFSEIISAHRMDMVVTKEEEEDDGII